MSWLSKALKGNALKIGTFILGSKFAGEYFFGETSYTPFGDATYKGGNFFGDALAKAGITPFKETAVGKSFLGDAIELFRPGESKSSLVSAATQMAGSGLKMPQAPEYGLNVGTQSFRSGQAFQAGSTQMMSVGRGGAITAALGREGTQQYLARKVAGLRLPTGSSLPSPNVTTSGSIQTTSSRSRSYKKLTG